MTTSSSMSQSQRQAYEKTLRDALYAAQREHERKDTEARKAAIQSVAADSGAAELAKQVIEYEQKFDESRTALEKLGFYVRNSELRLDSDAPQAITYKVDAMVKEATASERKKVETITDAINKSWTTSTLDEAKQVVAAFA